MRILRVADIPGGEPGGMHGYMTNSGRAMTEMGHAVRYLFREGLGRRPRHPGLRRLTAPWTIPLRVVQAQRRGMRFDVVEIHEPLAAPYAFLAGRGAGALPPCVVLSHGIGERLWREKKRYWKLTGQSGPLKSRILVPPTLLAQSRYGLRRAAQVAVLSSDDVEYLQSEVGVPPSRIATAPTGVAPRFFEVPPRPPPERRALRVLFIGSWIDRKGVLELAEAWGALCRRFPHVTLTLVGTTATPRERVLSDFPVHSRDQVVVAPLVPGAEMPRLLGEYDLFVLPAWFEGLPLATLEAAASGLPCVVGATSGNADFFSRDDPERFGGVLVPSHDSSALAAAIERFIADPGLGPRLGQRARERARSYSWPRTAEGLIGAYERAVNGA